MVLARGWLPQSGAGNERAPSALPAIEAPSESFACVKRHDLHVAVPHQSGYVLRLPPQRYRALVERQAVEARTVLGREGLEAIQRAFLLEGQGVAFEGCRGTEDPGAAAGAFLFVFLVRRRIRAEEEPGIARRRRPAQCLFVAAALGDRKAVRVRPEPALEHGVAVNPEVVCGNRCRHVRTRRLDELHGIVGRDVFEYDLEAGEILKHRRQHGLQEHSLPVENVDIGRHDLAVHEEQHADRLHTLQHGPDLAHVRHAGRRIGGGAGWIELAGVNTPSREPPCDLPPHRSRSVR